VRGDPPPTTRDSTMVPKGGFVLLGNNCCGTTTYKSRSAVFLYQNAPQVHPVSGVCRDKRKTEKY